MSRDRSYPKRLRQRADEAVARYGRGRAEIARRGGEPPRQGEVFAFTATAGLDHPVLWAVIHRDPRQVGRYEVVAADLNPLVGSADVAVPPGSACGALTLRCGFSLALEAEDFRQATRLGSLEEEILSRAQGKWAAIRAKAPHGSFLERETDDEWEVRYGLRRRLEEARSLLVKSLGPEVGMIHPLMIEVVADRCVKSAIALSLIAAAARESRIDRGDLRFLGQVHRAATQKWLGSPVGVARQDLKEAGWAIVLHAEESEAVKEALRPLIEHRREQSGEAMSKVLELRDGEGWRQFLARYGVSGGSVQPARVPYYLLLVGSPSRIPWEVQLMLSAEYAVGRLSFDSSEEYRRYARGVVEAETSAEVPQRRTAAVFTPWKASDPAAARLADRLLQPLAERDPGSGGLATLDLRGEGATKDHLGALFDSSGGTRAPALFVAATHGLAWPPGPEQRANQGALLCQQGSSSGEIDPARDCYRAADLTTARVPGMIAMLASSYSAGTTARDPLDRSSALAARAADEPFVAALAQRLVAGGALAVLGSTDRSWGFGPSQAGWVEALRNTLEGLLAGEPAGHALRHVKRRWAELATRWQTLQKKLDWGGVVADDEAANLWSEWSEARSWVILGDPAVRLRVEDQD